MKTVKAKINSTKGAKETQQANSANPVTLEAKGERLLTMDEELALCRAISHGTTRGGFTQAEAEAAWEWATVTRGNQMLLEGVLEGLFAIRFRDDGELLFGAIDPQTGLMANAGTQPPVSGDAGTSIPKGTEG
jgi:hypothetical protein